MAITKRAERARYNGRTVTAFASAIGVDRAAVYAMIDAGWFRWTKDAHGNLVPECQDVRRPGSPRPSWRIHDLAIDRWFRERAVGG